MNTRYLFGLPFVTITVNSEETEFLVDTGFNGELLLPRKKIRELKLTRIGRAEYIMADGKMSESEMYAGQILWLGAKRTVYIVAAEAELALIGMDLLKHAKTTLIPVKNVLVIEPF